MIRIILSFLAFVTFARAYTGSSPTLYTDGSRDDVNAAITAAINGDTIIIPPGTYVWNSGIIFSGKYVKIQGAGAGRMVARSTGNQTIGTGTKTFTLADDVDGNGVPLAAITALKSTINIGEILTVYRTGGTVSGGLITGVGSMTGTVTNIAGNSLEMNITSVVGSGEHPLWVFVDDNSATGSNGTTIQHNTYNTNLIEFTVSSAGSTEISGIRFEHAAGAAPGGVNFPATFMVITHNATTYPAKIHDCTFIWGTQVGEGYYGWGIYMTTNRALIWDCSFVQKTFAQAAQALQIAFIGDETSWSTTSTMGTADTTGYYNTYVEDCNFAAFSNIIDLHNNARFVLRNCALYESGAGSHGFDSTTHGVRHWEFYNNHFSHAGFSDGKTLNRGWCFYLRGGTGVITDNTLEVGGGSDYGARTVLNAGIFAIGASDTSGGTNFPHGWGRGYKAISSNTLANPTVVTTSLAHGMVTGDYVRISDSNSTPTIDGYHQVTVINSTSYTVAVNVTVAGTAGKSNRVDYPAPRQFGFGRVTGAGVDGSGATESPALSGIYVGDQEPGYFWNNTNLTIGLNSGEGGIIDPDIIADYLKVNREYFLSAKPSYTKFTYPHPLRTDLGGTPFSPGKLRGKRR